MIFLVAQICTYLSLAIAVILLGLLFVIDLRHRLLLNKYVFPFGALGLVFHASLNFTIFSLESLIIAGFIGYIFMYFVRWGGSRYYGQEAMGLGDVKLIAMAGLWLGLEYLMLAITIGAACSLVHGVVYAYTSGRSLRRLEIPAGPGLITGIVIMIGWMLHVYQTVLPGL